MSLFFHRKLIRTTFSHVFFSHPPVLPFYSHSFTPPSESVDDPPDNHDGHEITDLTDLPEKLVATNSPSIEATVNIT